MEKRFISYTTIQHNFRIANNLSCNEYVLCDMINVLSQNSERSSAPGWCYMTRENLADQISLSKQTVINLIEKLIEAGFISRNEFKQLRTTDKWKEVYYFTDGKESLPELTINGKESLPNPVKKVYPINNIDNNNKKEKGNISPSEKLKIKKDTFYKNLRAYQKEHPEKYPAGLYKKFIAYWTEEHKNGKKIRLDDQDYFDIGKRLSTFWGFTKEEERNQFWKEHNDAKKTLTLNL